MSLPCFLSKIAEILQKVIVLFRERGEEIEPWVWHIWIAQWVKLFPNTAYFLWFFGVKVGLKVQILGPLVFHRSSNPSKTFQTMFLFPLVGGFGPFIWESKGPKSPNKRNFMDAESVRKTLDYVSSWECKPKTSYSPKFSIFRVICTNILTILKTIIYAMHYFVLQVWKSFCTNWTTFRRVFHECLTSCFDRFEQLHATCN